VGDARIGIALSDPLGLTAQRLTVVTRTALARDVEAVRRLVGAHGVERIVIGLPLTMQGERGIQANKVEAFAAALGRAVAVPVTLIDERLTTVQGERALRETGTRSRRRKQVIDQVAAQLILQQFLDTLPRA
jgi:putative Holliday junction resolvase